jgi:hypothetical protein
MELLDARSLADMIIEDGPLAPRAVAKIGIALLGALEVAHAAGVLHRDVKPANVLIASDGRCVLTDFGVARMPTDVQLTTPGMVLGSPHFISPERAMGSDFGPPSDLFSLGVTLYTAVEGRPPFDRGDPIETMHAVVEDPPAPPARAGVLTPVLHGLLEKDPARRWDVQIARAALRELLAGPLASTAAAHLMTDPYAVVPAQRSPWQAPVPTPAQPTGQIGGRAMIGPGESLTDRLAQLRNGGAAARPGDRPTAGRAQRWDAPTGQAQPWDAPTGQAPWQHSSPQLPAEANRRAGALTGVRQAGGGLLGAVRRWPRSLQIAAGAGLAATVLAAVLIASLGPDPAGPAGASPVGQTSPATSQPLIPAVQTYRGKGVEVNVPEGWKKDTGGLYVDFTDTEETGRRVRILVEPASGEPDRFLERAEGFLKKSKSCRKPYARVDLRAAELAGQQAAELEYTCGDGTEMRHGIWRAVIQDGKAYSFYLTVPQDRYDDSKAIFDEMVRSFALTTAG